MNLKSEYIKCPFCTKLIKSEAVKCRFCGEWFNKKNKFVIFKLNNKILKKNFIILLLVSFIAFISYKNIYLLNERIFLLGNLFNFNNKTEFLITNESIGFVKFGMNWQQVINLYKKDNPKIDLIDNTLVLSDKNNNKSIISVSSNNVMNKNYNEKIIDYYMATANEKYSTENGIKVGMSIEDLEKKYPNISIYRNVHDQNEIIDISKNISLIVENKYGEVGLYNSTSNNVNETKKYKNNSKIIGIEIRNKKNE